MYFSFHFSPCNCINTIQDKHLAKRPENQLIVTKWRLVKKKKFVIKSTETVCMNDNFSILRKLPQ